jgi:hypothetical protein
MNKYTILDDKKIILKEDVKEKKIKYEECPICFEDLNFKSTIEFVCEHKYHLRCLNEWKDKKEEEGYVYICEICQTPRDVKNIVLTEEDIKKNRKSLFKKCVSCLGF